MKYIAKVPNKTVQSRVGHRWFSSSPPQLSAEAMTLRSKGYGPTKHLLRGVDTAKKIILETSLHPMDAEMQRRVLSLSSADVSVLTPLDSKKPTAATTPVQDPREMALQQGIMAIAPDQLASMATVVVDQVREQLELSGCAAEAVQDSRAASVVNAVASCLRQEMERLLLATHTQEVSFSHMLQENSNLICARVADVIRAERLSTPIKKEVMERQRLSQVVEGVASTLANLEHSLKSSLEANFAAIKNAEPVSDDVRVHVVAAIEQASHLHQERLIVSLEDLLAKRFPMQTSVPQPPSIEAIEDVVKSAMIRVVEDTRREVWDLLQEMRSKDTASSHTESSPSERALEGLLASYGERLEEMREATMGFSDLKELMMEVHNQQQISVTEINEVKVSITKLKKELMRALHEVGSGISATNTIDSSVSQLEEYRDKLNALADQVISTVEQQLKEQYVDVKELTGRLLELEKVLREKHTPAIRDVPPPLQEFDDERMVTLAQSISASIIASLPPREESSPQISLPAPRFTDSDIELVANAVAKVLGPKLDTLAAAAQVTQAPKTAPMQTEGNMPLMDEDQLITLAQTIADSVREAVRDTVSLHQQQQEQEQEQQLAEASSVQKEDGAVLERLEGLKETIIAAVREEMGYAQEIDLTPLQSYLDGIFGDVQKALDKQQEMTQTTVEGVIEAVGGRFDQQKQHLTQLNQTLSDEVKGIISGDVARLLSSLNTVHEEVREAVRQSPEALETKLASIETLLHEALSAEQERGARAQVVLEGVTESIKNATDENSRVTQALASINESVAQLARQNAASSSEVKILLSTTEVRAEALHAQMTTEISRRFSELQAELLAARQRIDELVSSASDDKGVASAVESMRVKLDEVGRSLNGMALQDELRRHQAEEAKQLRSLESLDSKLGNLSATTQEILSKLQEYRPLAGDSQPALQSSLPVASVVTSEDLEAMEGRLGEQFRALQTTLDGLTQLDGGKASVAAVEETPQPLGPVTGEVNRQIREIDALIKLVSATRGVQAKEMREKLVALRLFLAAANLEGVGAQNTAQLLEALENNRLKLTEDVTAAEAELVRQVNEKIQQVIVPLLGSVETAVASSTEVYVQRLHDNLDNISKKLDTHHHQLALQLQDRIQELEKYQGERSADIVMELQKSHKEWQGVLERVMQQEMAATLRGSVAEVCTEQLLSVHDELNKQRAAEEKSGAALLSSVQQLSHEVSQLGALGGELRTAVAQGSRKVFEELQRTHEGLAARFEQGLSATRAGRETLAAGNMTPALSQAAQLDTATVVQTSQVSLWWLLALSLIVFMSIVLCAYILFAAFLVAFVPVPPPEDLLLSAAQPSDEPAVIPKKLSSRVVDQVIL